MVLSRRKLQVQKQQQVVEEKPLDEVMSATESGKRPLDVEVLEVQTTEEKRDKRMKRRKSQTDEVQGKPANGAGVNGLPVMEELDDLTARKLRKKMMKANRRMGKEGDQEPEANDLGFKDPTIEGNPALEGEDLEARSLRKKQMKADRKGGGEKSQTNGGEAAVKKLQNGGEEKNQKKKKKSKGANRWGEKERMNPGEQEVSGLKERGEDQRSTTNGNLQEYEGKKVFVGGMPYSVTEDDIVNFFADCGRVAELDCVTFPDTGKFRGLVFITFESEAGAEKALALDGADMWGRYLKVQRCKVKPPNKVKPHFEQPPSKHADCKSAYIGNLAWDVSEEELKDFFRECDVTAIRFAHDKNTGEFRGFGHVDFADDKSLDFAVSLDQQEVHGRPIKIAYAVPKRH